MDPPPAGSDVNEDFSAAVGRWLLTVTVRVVSDEWPSLSVTRSVTVLVPAFVQFVCSTASAEGGWKPAPRSHSYDEIEPSRSTDPPASSATSTPLSTVAGVAVNDAVGVREKTVTDCVASAVL